MTHQAPQTKVGLTSRDTGRSTYVQVRDLVEHLQNQDRRLRQLYRQEATSTDDDPDGERAALLYRYAAEREQSHYEYLDRLADKVRERILDTWLQYGGLSDYDERVDAMLDAPPGESRDIQARLTELDRQLASAYRRLEDAAEVPGVAEFFRRLREVTEQRARENSEQVQQIEEL